MESCLWNTAVNRYVLPPEQRIVAGFEPNAMMFERSASALNDVLSEQKYLFDERLTVTDIIVVWTVNWGHHQRSIDGMAGLGSYPDCLLARPHCALAKNQAWDHRAGGKMRAVHVEDYDTIENVRICDVEKPKISSGQILARVQAVGIGFVDGLKVRGLYQTKDPLPFTPGMEFAGVVEETADNVETLTPGARVMGVARNGALAEYVAAFASDVNPIPDGVAVEKGAGFLSSYLTALYALKTRARLQEGERLLVLGAAGGTGTAAIQVGKALGAHVIAAASTAQKRAFAERAGADGTVDYTQPNWREALRDATDGHGPDVIFDPVGGAVSEQAFRSIAWNGRHIVVGFASGEIPALKFNLPLLKGGILLGVDLAQLEQKEPGVRPELVARLLDWLREGRLVPMISSVYAFDEFRDAFRAMEERSALGKIVIRINAS